MSRPLKVTSIDDPSTFDRLLTLLRSSKTVNGGVLQSNFGNLAQRALRQAEVRNTIFAGVDHLFGDPGWYVLLCLYSDGCAGKPSNATTLATATGTAATTLGRYLVSLTRAGLIAKRPDWADRRQTFIELTARGSDLMERYLASIEW